MCLKLQRGAKTLDTLWKVNGFFSVIQRLLPSSMPIHVCEETEEKKGRREEEKRRREDEKRSEVKRSEVK